jgi:uncharacterized RDD family membrane protein YckC
MPWFYANAGQQVGPIDDASFERLTRDGVIQLGTLVWREGMAQWEPLANIGVPVTPVAAAEPAAPNQPVPLVHQVLCDECRKLVPAGETMQVGNAIICVACKPIYVQKLREGAVAFNAQAFPMRYAGFWIRLGAKAIDEMIMLIASLPFSFIFDIQLTLNPGKFPDLTKILLHLSIIVLLGFLEGMLYTWLLVGRYGATPGKMLVGIKIVTTDGQRISYLRSFARFWAEIVSALTFYIGYIIAGFDEEKRALHDHMCNTRVVYK